MPNSAMGWNSRPPFDRYQRGSTDQSTRSASLTSIVEMYQRSLTNELEYPLPKKNSSFYYDYSEEFDSVSKYQSRLKAPICPIPQRASSINQPFLAEETQQSLNPGISASSSTNTSSSTSDSDGFQHLQTVRNDANAVDSKSSYESCINSSADNSIRKIERVIVDTLETVTENRDSTALKNSDGS